MNIQQIEYVIAVSELKNFKQAAERCFITQSTLSTMVAKFEEELGIIIFDRKTKPITITKEGRQIINQLKIIIMEINDLKEVVQDLKGEIGGKLKIGVIPTVGPYLLPLFLNEFVENFPNVQFEVSEITTEKMVNYLTTRELDVGIASIPLNHPDLIEIPLYNEPFLLYDHTDNNRKENLTVSEIDFDRLWLLEEGHCMRTQVEKICGLHEKRTAKRNLEYKSGTLDTLLKFVIKNNGITLLPLLATIDFPEKEQVFLKKFEAPVPARSIGLIVHKHFVKRSVLEILQLEIQDKVIPLIGKKNVDQRVIPPS